MSVVWSVNSPSWVGWVVEAHVGGSWAIGWAAEFTGNRRAFQGPATACPQRGQSRPLPGDGEVHAPFRPRKQLRGATDPPPLTPIEGH
jgi:hypothetical protein